MANQKKLLLIFRNPPFSSSANRDNLDIALACSAFDIPVSLLFLNDAVLQLLKHQQSDLVDQKDLTKTLYALEMYDIDQCFIVNEDLDRYQLAASDLMLNCQTLFRKGLASFIHDFDVVINI
jgi:tRNA 2-thiouridine synthesizing protein C